MTEPALTAALDQARSALEPLLSHPVGPAMHELTMRSVTQALQDESLIDGNDLERGVQLLMFRFAAYGIASYERDIASNRT